MNQIGSHRPPVQIDKIRCKTWLGPVLTTEVLVPMLLLRSGTSLLGDKSMPGLPTLQLRGWDSNPRATAHEAADLPTRIGV